jgi:uncharacterized LabA/DUF88 family protein
MTLSYTKQNNLGTAPDKLLGAEHASIAATVIGTIFAGLSQQVAFACVPMSVSLLLMRRRYELEQKLTSRQDIVVNIQQATYALKQQIDNLSIEIKEIKQDFPVSSLNSLINQTNQKYLTKTHLQPLINQLHQVQRQQKVIQLGAIADLTKTISALTEEVEKTQQQICQLQQVAKPKNISDSQDRVAMFIDASNIYHVGKELGITVNYSKLRARFQKSKSFQAYFYTGVNSSNHKELQFLSNIRSLGYKIISKEIIRQPDGIKANLDVELALDMHNQALNNQYDTAMLFSGDGDFVDLVKRLKKLGKFVSVVSFRARTNKELIKLADSYLDLAEIKDEI